MVIKSAEFVTSIANIQNYKSMDLPEFAFVGRSNVGKSSLLNALCRNNKLAKTSSTPGRTRLVNLFLINKQMLFVDLPGYGYAKASKQQQQGWQSLIGGYLELSSQLKHVFMLVDSRHEPSEKDKEMIKYLYVYQIPFSIIATKTDKLSRAEINKNMVMIASTLGVGAGNIIPVSAEKKTNLDKVLAVVEQKLENQ